MVMDDHHLLLTPDRLSTYSRLATLQGFLERTMTKKNRKDFLSTVGPFLLVVTFLEDGKHRVPSPYLVRTEY